MKKILTLLLVLLLALTCLVGCDVINGLLNGDNGDENPTPEVDADLQAAYDYVHQMTKTVTEVTGANYDVAGAVKIGEKTYTVKWEVSDSKISLQTSEDGLTVTVVVPSRTYEDIPYTLKFTVTNEKGETLSREYSHVVPEFKVSSFEEYMAAEEGDNLVVKGIVVAINSKAAGNTRNHLFLADEDVVGGYYSYQMEADPVADLGIEVGMTVLVTGPAAPYSGMMEIKGGVAEIVSTEKKTVDFVDATADFAAGDNLAKYTALPVVIKGVTISTQELGGTSEYLKFSLNGHTSYIRTYVTDFPTTLVAADKATIDTAHADHYGWVANVYGVVVLYSGNPYLIPLSVDCFEYLNEVEKTPAEKIADTISNIDVPGNITADTTVELPLVGKNYDDVTIAWAIDNTDYTIGADGKLPITLTSNEVTVKLTATVTCGDASDTAEFTVVISANLVMNENHAYASYLVQVTNGTVLYLDGGVSGRYLTTTTELADAVSVYAEKAQGGYKLYILVDGAKQYITVYNNAENKVSVNYDANGTSVYTYNKAVNAWVTVLDGTEYYLGTYSTFATISASKLSYINEENTGVSQFPLEILPVAPGSSFNMFINQVTNGNVIYLDGGVSGRYLTTVTDAADAVLVYAEKVDGGFKFYILVDDVKQYITIYNNAEGKLSVNYDANGATVYNYDPLVNVWASEFEGTVYYLGTYSTFGTVSASKISYINVENTGVSQFPLDIVLNIVVCEHTNTTSETVDATCTAKGSTTVTCADCGKVVSTTEIAANGHSYTDGTCSVCGAAQPAAGSVTVSKTVEELITALGWDNTTTGQEFSLDDNVTVKVAGGSNTGKAYDGNHIRIYATDTPAGSLTISVLAGYELVSVKITTVEGTYAFLCVGDGTTDICNVETAVSGSSVVLNSVKNGSDGKQVRVLAIEVVYQPV